MLKVARKLSFFFLPSVYSNNVHNEVNTNERKLVLHRGCPRDAVNFFITHPEVPSTYPPALL